MYDYTGTPPGMGDTFFQYVFDAQGAGLVDGTDRMQLGVEVDDGDFLLRYWSGLPTIADRLNIYDWLGRRFASEAMFLGAASLAGYGQLVVQPEVKYPHGGNLRFDLTNITQALAGVGLDASQLVFTGVRRRVGAVSDPAPSSYKYYEKRFNYPYTLSINNYGIVGADIQSPVQYTLPITEYDFELRRVELSLQESHQNSQFKITLYNQDWRQVSNLPVLSNLFCHLNPTVQTGGQPFASNGELSFWPAPPLLYKVNSVIRFDIYSLLVSPTVLPQTFQLLFDGVRRIPC
jgi:hypothetical protein